MRIKQNLLLKILAFLLALVTLAAAGVLACYQITEIEVLWGDEPVESGHRIHWLQQQASYDLKYLVEYLKMEDLTPVTEEWIKETQEAYSAENTNLRWQVRDTEENLLHGNVEGQLPAAAYDGFWTYFTLDDTTTVLSGQNNWLSLAADIYTLEELPAQVKTGAWKETLQADMDAYLAGDHSIDLDAVYTNAEGNTDVLMLNASDGMRLYGPTIRSVLETNESGYRYVLGEGWVRYVAGAELQMVLWLDETLAVQDEFKEEYIRLSSWKTNRVTALLGTIALIVAWLLLTIYLCVTCGHKKGREGIYLNWFHHIPGDLLLAVYIFAAGLLIALLVDTSYYWYQYPTPLWFALTLSGLWAAGAELLVTSFLITFVARCKGRALLRHTVIGWICIKLWRLCRAISAAIPLIWKVAVVGAVYLFFSFLLVGNGYWIGGFWVFLWVLVSLLLIAYLCWWALQWKRVRQGAREIISGNTDYHIDDRRMPPDLKAHADELNNLGQAIGVAVEERMRSEHFKAELITNVSHDLKTPLTSIISYVDLLKKENIENPKAQEYIEVLDRKSQRLKKLTEDLVEASKASTGALNVVCERLNLIQLADQALAEYEDRLAQHGLTVVRTMPAEPVWVQADGRHLWRVLDNLLSNCAKYALEGTRVYVEVQAFSDCARLSVKNISRDELNIPAEQLTERFVRGDESRTMEGSGLGLSIAQSLTDLQHGDFEIAIDGDLFKATVTLPLAPQTELS